MSHRYSPPPHPHPERTSSFNPLAHLLKHLADSPPTSPVVFTKVDLAHPDTHDPQDILREIRSDGDNPFPVDRNVLKKVVQKKMGHQVQGLSFISSGTFHKAFLVTLDDGRDIVARIARRYMPRLKTESEVATINYIRQHTDIPVPIIYHFDSNPFNRLGGEYILMSKAPGIPLHHQYRSFTTETLHKFLRNLATIIITLFSHRFPMIGSLYQQPLHPSPLSSSQSYQFRVGPIVSWPFFGGGRGERSDIPRGPWHTAQAYLQACADREITEVRREGEGRVTGHRPHLPPDDIEVSSDEEGPTTGSLSRIGSLNAIAIRGGVGPAHQGSFPIRPDSFARSTSLLSGGPSSSKPTRPGLSNKRHHSHRGAGLRSVVNSVAPSAYPSDEDPSSSSDEEAYRYMDYRSHIRSSLLVTHQQRRLESCKKDMMDFMDYMTTTLGVDGEDPEFEGFSLDLHDLSTANVFVDPDDLGKITCIIDWESTCVRPLWQCAHLPSFLANDPGSAEADLFRQIISELAPSLSAHSRSTGMNINGHPHLNPLYTHLIPSRHQPPSPSLTNANPPSSEVQSPPQTTPELLDQQAQLWLKGEREREEWRRAHKVVEWDGWEEGLVGNVLGDLEVLKSARGGESPFTDGPDGGMVQF